VAKSAGKAAARGARPAVTVVGLGPAGPEYLSAAAAERIAAIPDWYVRTARHPAAEPLVAGGAVALDHHYEAATSFGAAYAAIVEEVVAAARSHGRVGYAVPGSPYVLEATVRALAADSRVEVDVVAGMSFCDLAWARLGIDPVESRVRLVEGERFGVDAARDTGPLLVAGIWAPHVLEAIKLAVATPPARAIVLQRLGCADERVEEVDFSAIDRIIPDHLTSLYLPELAEPVGIELARLEEVVETLRDRCPWDAVQTHRSLVRHLIEECYEAVEAIEELGEPPDIAASAHLEEELGDVLCQVLFHSVLASREGLFTFGDVAQTLHDKLVSRHPHVFAGVEGVGSVDAVLTQWEELKRREKGRESVMDGIPAELPALLLVAKLERQAAGVGLGWEVTGEATAAYLPAVDESREVAAESLGALLLGLARWAADRGIDAEEAVRHAARQFRTRFAAAERLAGVDGTTLAAASSAARRAYWQAAGTARGA
jgi:tetrapyrrole methylase family protein/MazG family protein